MTLAERGTTRAEHHTARTETLRRYRALRRLGHTPLQAITRVTADAGYYAHNSGPDSAARERRVGSWAITYGKRVRYLTTRRDYWKNGHLR